MFENILRAIRNKSRVGLLVIGIFLLADIVSAEPQFGGDVSGVRPCTCGSNAGGYYFEVDDPHGDGSGGHGKYVASASPLVVKDCAPIKNGEEVLGLHNENDEECKQIIANKCIKIASGKGVDVYGTSPSNCTIGLGSDASGDGKTAMVTPDGRKSDGDKDAHLVTSYGQDYEGAHGLHMLTPDNQDDEGLNTSHMSVDGRIYDGFNDVVMTASGAGEGYSAAGGGRPGGGYGSIGGSVGSLGLGSPGNSGSSRACPDNCSATVAGITSQCSAVANGGRPHFRFPSPGGTVCPGTCMVEIDCGGQSESYIINNGGSRDDRGGFLWKPESESNGNLVILGPSSMVIESADSNSVDSSSNSSSSSSKTRSAASSVSMQSINNNESGVTNSNSSDSQNVNTSDDASEQSEDSQNSGQGVVDGNNLALGTSLISVLGDLTNGKEMLRMLFVIGSIGGAGYFVFKSMKKVL